MANFEEAYKRTAIFEGGYTADPDDNGNWTGGKKGVGELVGTNYGVTAIEMGNFLNRKATIYDMRNMQPATAAAIFKKNYWDTVRADEIENQDLANAIFDSAINMGTGTAIILAKRSQGLQENTHMDNEIIKKLNNTA